MFISCLLGMQRAADGKASLRNVHYAIKIKHCGSDNMIAELPNAAYSFGQHGPVTGWHRQRYTFYKNVFYLD